MPANVFANTPTSVSVLFFDRTEKNDGDKVILIDASKLGEEYKEGNNQKRRLRPEEVEKIVKTFCKVIFQKLKFLIEMSLLVELNER